MIKKSYSKNYLKIYFWQGISLILNFLSMFIVVPYLTKDPNIYGIYSVCISISIFLAYADFGFIGAGQKYAAEYFAIGESNNEIRVIGFTSFVLLVFLLILSIVFLYLSFDPYILINNLSSEKELSIASSLLLILALSTPITLMQRLSGIIFSIRVETYIFHRINIVGSLIKILSVFWFFRTNHTDIIGYYLFLQIINFLVFFIALIIANSRYKIDYKTLLLSIKFSKEVFNKTKNLAFSSLYLTLTWILYYEMDTIVIAKFSGASLVALYAIALTILSFFRSILSIMFAPFDARINHYVGLKDYDGLKDFFAHITTFLAPLVIIPIVSVSLFAKPLVLSWVGPDYFGSIVIVKIIVLSNLFAYLTYPGGILLMAQERLKIIYLTNTLLPLIYWLGIICTFSELGLKSFAIFKLAAFIISASIYIIIIKNFLNIKFLQIFKMYFLPFISPIGFAVLLSILIGNRMTIEKSSANFIVNLFIVFLTILFSLLSYFIMSKNWRNQTISYLKKTIRA